MQICNNSYYLYLLQSNAFNSLMIKIQVQILSSNEIDVSNSLFHFELFDQIHEFNITLKFIGMFKVVIHKTLIIQIAHFIYSLLHHELKIQIIVKYRILLEYLRSLEIVGTTFLNKQGFLLYFFISIGSTSIQVGNFTISSGVTSGLERFFSLVTPYGTKKIAIY